MREKVPRFIEKFQTDDKTVKHTKYCKALRFVYKGGNCPDEKTKYYSVKKNLHFNRSIYNVYKGGKRRWHR